MERESSRRPRKSGGPNYSLLVIGGVLIAGVAVIAMNMGGQEAPQVDPSKDASFDPFASVPEEEPPVRGSSSSGTKSTSSSTSSDPFGSVSSYTSDARYVKAVETADRAQQALDKALAAHADGNRQKAREEGTRAQKLFGEALDGTAALRDEIEAEFGEDSSPARRIGKARQKWNQSIMTLKKSAFM